MENTSYISNNFEICDMQDIIADADRRSPDTKQPFIVCDGTLSWHEDH